MPISAHTRMLVCSEKEKKSFARCKIVCAAYSSHFRADVRAFNIQRRMRIHRWAGRAEHSTQLFSHAFDVIFNS
jgi:hypothetical protein